MSLAPIVLFVFNRPKHTELTLNALAANELAADSELFVFCDGPRNETDAELVKETLSLIESERRFKNVYITKRTENWGLGKSILSGVTEVIEKYKRVIVLEDDLLTQPQFLRFMNYYLDYYESDKNVFHISGFQKESWLQFILPPIYFSRFMNCWGWATWSDRWEQLNTDLAFYDNYLAVKSNKDSFDYEKLEQSNQFELNREGFKTWAIFWYGTIQANNKLCLNPRYSFVQNIGDDGSGTNRGKTETAGVRNRAVKFHPHTRKPIEGRVERWHIQEAYARRSRLKYKFIKDGIFAVFSFIRNRRHTQF